MCCSLLSIPLSRIPAELKIIKTYEKGGREGNSKPLSDTDHLMIARTEQVGILNFLK